uniref:CCHC-type domain-containing protein n=1 Tax=Chenopodium quinoa TaxID=63459 RepID=A0A803L2P2_CHEQI
MADDIADRWAQMSINEEESNIVDISEVSSTEQEARVSLLLIGKLLTDRGVNFEAFKRTMIQSWMMKGKVVIRSLGINLYAFQFFHWRDKERVMTGRPWCFEQNLLLLNSISGDEQPTEVSLTHSPFWIRIENLPFNCRSDAQVRAIAANLGEVLEVEEEMLMMGKSRRVKVNLDVRKPLRRFQNIRNKEGNVVRTTLKYERLPFFCFLCGIMGHSERDCLNAQDDSAANGHAWGIWLKASPMKGRKVEGDEIKELKLAKKLVFVPKNDIGRCAESENSVDVSGERVHRGGGEMHKTLVEKGEQGECEGNSSGGRSAGEGIGGTVGLCGSSQEVHTHMRDACVDGEVQKTKETTGIGGERVEGEGEVVPAPILFERGTAEVRKEVVNKLKGTIRMGKKTLSVRKDRKGGMGSEGACSEDRPDLCLKRKHGDNMEIDDENRGEMVLSSKKDLGFKGCKFTWQRGQSLSALIRERLDRFLACDCWCGLFPYYNVNNLPINVKHSDHAPIILKAGLREENRRKKRIFRFEALWLSKSECESVVKSAWNNNVADPIHMRIANCAESLSLWASNTFGDIRKRIKKAEERLLATQQGVMDGVNLHRCWSISQELDELLIEIPTPPPNGLYDHDLKVAQLIDYQAGQWDQQEMELHFQEDDISSILTLPLHSPLGPDVPIWGFNNSGMFTVKTAYWLAVGSELHRRHLRENGVCQRCNEAEETISHALFQCRSVQAVWQRSPFHSLVATVRDEPFCTFFSRWAVDLSREKLCVMSTLMWALWMSRNKTIHANEAHDPQALAGSMVRYVADYNSYSTKVSGGPNFGSNLTATTWKKPAAGTIKINVDAALFQNAEVGVGVVARNSEGTILFTAAKRMQGCWDPAKHKDIPGIFLKRPLPHVEKMRALFA